jgi:limonene-1,2-epoxide hydrolase
MPSFPRKEVEETANRFAAANVRAESERDWGPLADFYTDDAVYSYVGLAAGGEVHAHGKEEIRKIVMGRDMEDYAGWTFPFQWIAIDGNRVITRWNNRAPGSRADGSPIECPGISVLEYAGDGKFCSQFDLFDRLSVKAVAEEAARLQKKQSKAAKKAGDGKKKKAPAKKAGDGKKKKSAAKKRKDEKKASASKRKGEKAGAGKKKKGPGKKK